MSVHVAVDAHNLARDDRGIGRYARAILSRALRDPGFRFSLVVRDLLPKRRAMEQAVDGAGLTIVRSVPRDADVVWFPWNGTFLRTQLPSVATVHDAAPFAYPSADARLRATEQTPFLKTAATARTILVQSKFTAHEVEHRLGVDAARIVITPLAADAAFSPGTPGTPGASATLIPSLRDRPYVLHVGAHDERKNTTTLIAGFGEAFASGEALLVFTRRPPVMPANAVVVEARDDATLVELYRGAAVVAVPSPYEGFGLPMLEAMASGAPVLGARAGALPEVGGDDVAWIDAPFDAHVWATALRELVNDALRRDVLRAAGIARAATFSWERCTRQTLDVLAAAAA